jgi:ferrous iron transport protein A
MVIPLDRLRSGQSAVVRSVEGGRGLVARLAVMGLRPGKLVVKVSSQFMGGPVTVSVDGRELAIGRGMAARVLVEPDGQP